MSVSANQGVLWYRRQRCAGPHPDHRARLCARGYRSQAPRAGSKPLPTYTDSQSCPFEKTPILLPFKHPTSSPTFANLSSSNLGGRRPNACQQRLRGRWRSSRSIDERMRIRAGRSPVPTKWVFEATRGTSGGLFGCLRLGLYPGVGPPSATGTVSPACQTKTAASDE